MKLPALIFSSTLLCFGINAFAGFHGEVSAVRNLPGYLNFDAQSTTYQGALSLKDRDDNVERRTPSQIFETYFNDGKLDLGKITGLKSELVHYDEQAFLIHCQAESKAERALRCEDDPSVLKKWKKNGIHLALGFAQKKLDLLSVQGTGLSLSNINASQNSILVEALYQAIEVWETIKGEDDQRSRFSPALTSLLDAKDMVAKTFIRADRPDASNLLSPRKKSGSGSLFYSEAELNSLREQGADLSLLDPPSNGMWRRPVHAIRTYQTDRYNDDHMVQLKKLYSEAEAQQIADPNYESSVVVKVAIPEGGNTPKIDVTLGGVKWKLKFLTDRVNYTGFNGPIQEFQKLSENTEVNTEPVVNSLAAAMGFTVDPTFFKRTVRVYFEDKVYQKGTFDKTLTKLTDLLLSRYDPVLNLASGFQVIKKDEQGRSYIEMKSATLELKSNPETDIKIGSFDRVRLGKDLMREHRAFALYLAFICDLDVKNGNDAVKLVPNGDHDYKVMFQNSDMGNGLAMGFPNVYNFPFVHGEPERVNGEVSSVRLNYPHYYPLPMLAVTNINDARWFARLLGQLTLPQIETAFSYAGYPKLVAKYYSQLVAKKRNQFLNALDLIHTDYQDSDGVSRKFELLEEFSGTIAGYEEYFKNGLLTDPENKLFDPNTEHFKRRWGINRQVFHQDETIDREIRLSLRNSAIEVALRQSAALLSRSILHNHGSGFEFARIIDHRLGFECNQNCFVQGADYGLRNFIPMRYLIDSPLKKEDPTKPLWIVDVMRIGFYVGDRGEILQGLLGFEVPVGLPVALGGRAFKIYEIIKVTPIHSINEFSNEAANFLKLPKYALPGLRDQVIGNLREGQTLLVSTYTGAEFQTRVRPTGSFFFNLRAGASIAHVNRTTIHHANGEFLVNWAQGHSTGKGVGVNFFDQTFQLPLVRQTWTSGKNFEETYHFQDSGTDQQLLFQNFVHPKSAELPDDHRLANRDSKTRAREGLISLIGLRSHKRMMNKIEAMHEDFVKNSQQYTKRISIAVADARLRDVVSATWKRTAEVRMDKKGRAALALNFDLNYPSAKKEKLLPLLEKNAAYLPKNLWFFDTESIKHYMGTVNAHSVTLYDQSRLAQVFSDQWTAESICEAFEDGCTNSFFRRYDRMRSAYRKLDELGVDAQDRFYKMIARFFVDLPEASEFAQVAIGKTQLLQSAKIESSLDAFPGRESTLTYGDEASVKDKKDKKLFSDAIEASLMPVFFTPITQ